MAICKTQSGELFEAVSQSEMKLWESAAAVPDPPKLTKEEILFLKDLVAHYEKEEWGIGGGGDWTYYGKKLEKMERGIAHKLAGKKFTQRGKTMGGKDYEFVNELVSFTGEPYSHPWGGHTVQDPVDPKHVKKAKQLYAHVSSSIRDFFRAHKKAYGY